MGCNRYDRIWKWPNQLLIYKVIGEGGGVKLPPTPRQVSINFSKTAKNMQPCDDSEIFRF